MSAIRLLYADDAATLASRVASALQRRGYVVDGRPAKAAVVIWSPRAATDDSLLAEARAALGARALAPVSVGKNEPPPSFEHVYPMDLAGWTGDDSDPRWRFVLDDIELAIRRDAEIPATPIAPAPAPYEQAPAPRLTPSSSPAEAPLLVAAAPRPARASPMIPALKIALAGATAVAALVGVAILAVTLSRRAAPPAPVAPTAEAAPTKGPTAKAPIVAYVAPDPQPAELTASPAPPSAIVAAEPSERLSPPGADVASAPEPTDPEALAALAALAAGGAAPAERAPAALDPPSTDETASIEALAWNATKAVSASQTAALGAYFRDCVDCPDMATLPAGGFLMGAPPDEDGRDLSESPQVEVAVARRFAIATKEVTAAEWNACVEAGACPPRPAGGGDPRRPVIGVSFDDARSYAAWLSNRTGANYRLPTEAEWEYAARAGSDAPYASGAAIAPTAANFDETPKGAAATLPAGVFAPNAFGLYDMHGNVWEWTADCWNESHAGAPGDASARGGDCGSRVVKGGAWNAPATRLRAAHRIPAEFSAQRDDLGFRVARDLP